MDILEVDILEWIYYSGSAIRVLSYITIVS